jgi:hypothetical protein
MAPKKTVEGPSRSNKIRFVLVEADISDGNLSELTQAITHALKPTVAPIRPALRAASSSPALPGVEVTTDDLQPDVQADVSDNEEPEAESEEEQVGSRSAKPKAKPPLPKYLPDLDLSRGNGQPFTEYAEEIAPKKHIKRYLAAAAWMKEHGGHETINTDIVYTMYKTAGWPLGMADWDANFRQAVKRDLMHRKSSGEYAITPLGEAALQKSEE